MERGLPLLVFLVVFLVTCYAGALLLIFGPDAVRETYVVETGSYSPPLSVANVKVVLILLNAAPVALVVGWALASFVLPIARAPTAPVGGGDARICRLALGVLVLCLALVVVRLAPLGTLSQIGAWHDYGRLVAERQRVIGGLWFGDFVLTYTVIPLLVAFLVAETLAGHWLTGRRAGLMVAGLLFALVAMNVALFQKRPLIDALFLIGVVTAFRLAGLPRASRAPIWKGLVWTVGTAGAVYVAGLLLPLVFGGTVYQPAVAKSRGPEVLAVDFDHGAPAWVTTSGNFINGGARYSIGQGQTGLGLQLTALPGQGVAHLTSFTAPPGSSWILSASLRSDVPQIVHMSAGLDGFDSRSAGVPVTSRWSEHHLCWTARKQTPRTAIAFQATRPSRLVIDDVRMESAGGSCDVAGVPATQERGALARPYRPPDRYLGRRAPFGAGARVTFPDPADAHVSSRGRFVITPVLGLLTRTAGPAISYPAIYPAIAPFQPLETGLDLVGHGTAATDNVTTWNVLFPQYPGGNNSVPFMFALFSQGGVLRALIGAFLIGILLRGLWALTHARSSISLYAPFHAALVVVFALHLAGGSVRDSLLASYGLVWPIGLLLTVAFARAALDRLRSRNMAGT